MTGVVMYVYMYTYVHRILLTESDEKVSEEELLMMEHDGMELNGSMLMTILCGSLCMWIVVHSYVYILYLCTYICVYTVQLNSNLTLARVSLAETQLIFKFARELDTSA